MADLEEFLKLLPEHKAGLMIAHNDHLNVYETVDDYTSGLKHIWLDDGDRLAAIEHNELWTIQWYPDTPVGFYIAAGSTLKNALEAAKSAA